MEKKVWQTVLIFILVAVLLLKPAAGVYAADYILDSHEGYTQQQSSEDFLKFTCELIQVALIVGLAVVIECILTNTTAGTTGHNVVASATESTGHLQTSVTPGEFPETPYNVQNKVSVEISAPPGTPPGKYSVELRAKGTDTNEAKQVITVHVDPPPLARIDVTPSEVTMNLGDQQQFQAKGYDAQGNEVSIDLDLSFTDGTITTGGLYTATTAGDFTVTAAVQGSTVTGTASVSVQENMPPWWAWIFFGFATLYVIGFIFWWLFFRRGALVPWWMWLLFGIAGLKVLGTLCYFLSIWIW